MNRRLEGPGLDAGRLDTSGREAQQVDGARGQAINRRRLNNVEKAAARTRETNGAARSERPETADFQPPSGSSGKSLDDALIDFIMPRIPDPAILRRSVSILQHCVTDLVPDLEGGEQLKNLARTLMQDEIERHRELLGRLQGGIET
jgi:hypothetical protein